MDLLERNELTEDRESFWDAKYREVIRHPAIQKTFKTMSPDEIRNWKRLTAEVVIFGKTEEEVQEYDAKSKAMDAAQRAAQYGAKPLATPVNMSYEEAMRIIGLREYEHAGIVRDFGERLTKEEVYALAHNVKKGLVVRHAESLLRLNLKKRISAGN